MKKKKNKWKEKSIIDLKTNLGIFRKKSIFDTNYCTGERNFVCWKLCYDNDIYYINKVIENY